MRTTGRVAQHLNQPGALHCVGRHSPSAPAAARLGRPIARIASLVQRMAFIGSPAEVPGRGTGVRSNSEALPCQGSPQCRGLLRLVLTGRRARCHP
jgi:hypothetical protein